jgi:hypothetical protein
MKFEMLDMLYDRETSIDCSPENSMRKGEQKYQWL